MVATNACAKRDTVVRSIILKKMKASVLMLTSAKAVHITAASMVPVRILTEVMSVLVIQVTEKNSKIFGSKVRRI